MDRARRRLFATCHNEMMVILDADSGRVVATLPLGKGTDAAIFDPDIRLAFSSNADGTLTVVREGGGWSGSSAIRLSPPRIRACGFPALGSSRR